KRQKRRKSSPGGGRGGPRPGGPPGASAGGLALYRRQPAGDPGAAGHFLLPGLAPALAGRSLALTAPGGGQPGDAQTAGLPGREPAAVVVPPQPGLAPGDGCGLYPDVVA